MSFPRYERYKDSGVEWLGEVPDHWQIERLKTTIQRCKNGVWGNDEAGDEWDIPCVRVADFDRDKLRVKEVVPTLRNVIQGDRNGRILRKGDLLLEKSGGGDLQPVGCVVLYDHDEEAVCSNFVARMQLASGMNASYCRYLHASIYGLRLTVRSINQTSGIQNLDQYRYLSESFALPTHEEQMSISTFLEKESGKIEELIEKQRHLIELLKEKRQAVISRTITQGLDLQSPVKFSGADWLGNVPSHWIVQRAGHLFVERDERSESGEEEMLTVSHLTGVTPRSEKTVNMFEAETTEGYKRVYPGDLVINTLWAWMGAMGVSSHNGIVSPAYHVYRPRPVMLPDYVNALVRILAFAKEASRWSKGVWSSRLRLYPQEMFQILFPVPKNSGKLVRGFVSKTKRWLS